MTHHDPLNQYLLHLADNGLVLGQRLCQWCTLAPVLEEETALMNTSLDLFGQARMWLNYAVQRDPNLQDCDALAMLRDERAYFNLLICEQNNGNFADSIARHYLFDVWHQLTLTALCNSVDSQIAAIANKAVLEVRYHEQRTRNWIIRLGDGTELSHQRVQEAIDNLWAYTGEMFHQDEQEQQLAVQNIIANQDPIGTQWLATVSQTLQEATLRLPENHHMNIGGKQGYHSEVLGIMLAEMQSLYRAHPGAIW